MASEMIIEELLKAHKEKLTGRDWYHVVLDGERIGRYRKIVSAVASADAHGGEVFLNGEGDAIYSSTIGELMEAEIAAESETVLEPKSDIIGTANVHLNLRADPSRESTKIAVLRKGTAFRILEQLESGWLKIETDKSNSGYGYCDNSYGWYVTVREVQTA